MQDIISGVALVADHAVGPFDEIWYQIVQDGWSITCQLAEVRTLRGLFRRSLDAIAAR